MECERVAEALDVDRIAEHAAHVRERELAVRIHERAAHALGERPQQKKSERAVSYRVPASAMGPLGNMNIGKSPRQRFELVMAAAESTLYTVMEKK